MCLIITRFLEVNPFYSEFVAFIELKLRFYLQTSPDFYRNDSDLAASNLNARERYNVSILKHVQAIFAHLGHSALQFYVPRGLWSSFK